MVMRAVGIQIFHLVLFERDLLKRVIRAEPVLERVSREQISQPSLYHSTQVAGRVMMKLHHLDRVALVQDHHSLSYIVSRDRHKKYLTPIDTIMPVFRKRLV